MKISSLPGCSSSCCAIKTPTGQMTNGPCSCKDTMLRARIFELEKDLKDAEEEIESIYKDMAGESI